MLLNLQKLTSKTSTTSLVWGVTHQPLTWFRIFDYIDNTVSLQHQLKATNMIHVFNQAMVDSLFFSSGGRMCLRGLWRLAEVSQDWGCWLRDKDRGRLPGERTGNEIWIDQIYLLSVHFNKVRRQSSGEPPNGRPPQEHGGARHRGRYFTGLKVWVYWCVLKSGARGGRSRQSVKRSSIDRFAFHKSIVLCCSRVVK